MPIMEIFEKKRTFPPIFPAPPVPAGRYIYILLNVKILLRSIFGRQHVN